MMQMRRFLVWSLGAILVLVVLYLASSIFFIIDDNTTLQREITSLESNIEAEARLINETLKKEQVRNANLKLAIDRYTKVAERTPTTAMKTPTESSLMCAAPYGIAYYPLLPYFYREGQNKMFREVQALEGANMLFEHTYGGTWGDIAGDLYPPLLLNSYNQSTGLYAFNHTHFQKKVSFPTGPARGSCWGDVNKDGWDDVILFGNGPDRFYINNASKFEQDNTFTSAAGDGLYCKFYDMTRDGHLDIIRVSASHELSILKGDPHKGFEDITNQTNLPRTISFIVGVNYFDREPVLLLVTSDGFLGFYSMLQLPYVDITPFFPDIPRYTPLVDVVVFDMNNDRQLDIVLLFFFMPPVIAYNLGHREFTTYQLPVLPELYGFLDAENVDLAIADFDNDMFPDIFVVRKTKFANAPNLLYINKEESFEVVYDAGGAAGSAFGRGDSVSLSDFNLDGYVDLAIFNGGGEAPFNVGPTQLFENTPTQNNWIEIELLGSGENTNGIGSIVGVKANGYIQVQVLGAQHSHRRLHFGLGNATVISKILIFWPVFHQTQVFYGVAPNQLVTLVDLVAPFPSVHHGIDLLSERGAYQTLCDPGLQRLRPAFFILGIWKAGTTSLSATLSHHPQIIAASSKEFYYFTKYYSTLSIEWYWSLFPCGNESSQVSFDGTAGYMFDQRVPALVHQYHPNAKFIIMLRDPLARAYSHFYMTTKADLEGPQMFDDLMRDHVARFNKCLVKSTPAECAAKGTWLFLNAGLYYYAIQRWFSFFDKEKFIFIQFNDFVGSKTDAVVADIQAFLGLEVLPLDTRTQNMSPKRLPMFLSTRQLLQDFYKPYNKLLYDLLNSDFGWDTVT